MKIVLENILDIEFICSLYGLAGSVIFLIWIIRRVKEIFFRSFVNFVCLVLMAVWVYQALELYMREFAYHTGLDVDLILEITVFFTLVDIGIWLIYKFMQAHIKKIAYRYSDADSPKRLKKEIEFLVNEQKDTQDAEMKKLYRTLQVSLLSIKKQQKIVRVSFLKNTAISVLFFILGLIIPKLILLMI